MPTKGRRWEWREHDTALMERDPKTSTKTEKYMTTRTIHFGNTSDNACGKSRDSIDSASMIHEQPNSSVFEVYGFEINVAHCTSDP